MFPGYSPPNNFFLQSTLSSASGGQHQHLPHHPITCTSGDLRFEEDGTFGCEHTSVGPDDQRTQQCLNHTVAILLLELAREKL